MPAPSKWDLRFLGLAQHVAGWSKDPSTKVGAVIADGLNRVVSIGYNGFPVLVSDHLDRYENRDQKLSIIVHAEMNAILFAQRNLYNCTLYTWPFAPCSRCAGQIIQSGIRRVIAPAHNTDHRWAGSINVTQLIFNEAGVVLDLFPE